LLALLFITFSGYSQYKISGYIAADEKEKMVYLSLLKYNEEIAIYPEQVILSVKTDSSGYFEFTGTLLPQVNKLYRIHSNREEDYVGLEFIEEGPTKNYHIFIFSNTDTIYFPKGQKIWFSNSRNSNKADEQWRKAVLYEQKLTQEYSGTRNTDAKTQAEIDFLNAYKHYCNDSLSDALVKLLSYSHMKRNVTFKDEEEDFKLDPHFYRNLLDELNDTYSGSSYYNQFLEEISMLSISVYKQKIISYKRLNYLFGCIMLLLSAVIVFQYLRSKKARSHSKISRELLLTRQEKKVAELICSGKTNKEIADRLFISLSTVKTHIGNINSKLNISSRDELIQILKNRTGD